MPLIDERGRLFGRMNLIDALAILVGLVLIPVAYTGFLLFRTPAPRITAVEPAEVPLGQEMRVKVKGTGLRSLFRANIDTDAMKWVETVPTEPGAHTTALDPRRRKLYAFLPRTHRAAVFVDE